MACSSSMDELVHRAQSGDRAAMEQLLLSVAPAIRRFAGRMCHNEADADDVLQDTLVAVTKNLPAFEGRSALTSWVFLLARTACSRRRRGKMAAPALGLEALDATASDAPSPLAEAEQHELARVLGEALDSLSDEHREVIMLRDVEGLSAAEAAVALELSVDALKSRLHRARGALREAIERCLRQGARLRPGCPDVARLWSDKLEGDLSARDCADMEAHIEACPACRRACHTLHGALLACQGAAGDRVPDALRERVADALASCTRT